MKPLGLDVLVCSQCEGAVDLRLTAQGSQEVPQGVLTWLEYGSEHARSCGVPRFVARDASAPSFRFQRNWFRTIQLDSAGGIEAADDSMGWITNGDPCAPAGTGLSQAPGRNW